MVVLIMVLPVLVLSSCSPKTGGGDNDGIKGSEIAVNYSITDEDFARIKTDFADGRFGYLALLAGSGEYESVTGAFYDVCMITSFIDDSPVARMDALEAVTLNARVSEWAIQFDSYENWGFADFRVITVPAVYVSHFYDEKYEGILVLHGTCEDESGSFDFEIVTRPWGQKWDDIAENNPEFLPQCYKDWYLPLLDSGCTMEELLAR